MTRLSSVDSLSSWSSCSWDRWCSFLVCFSSILRCFLLDGGALSLALELEKKASAPYSIYICCTGRRACLSRFCLSACMDICLRKSSTLSARIALFVLRCVWCFFFYPPSQRFAARAGGGERHELSVFEEQTSLSLSTLGALRLRPPQKTKKADGNCCVISGQGGGGGGSKGVPFVERREHLYLDRVLFKAFHLFSIVQRNKVRQMDAGRPASGGGRMGSNQVRS